MVTPIVGFDVGSLNSHVAVAKGGGIEMVINDYSERATPTCVAFAGRKRVIGTAAALQQATNVSNTVINFLPLLGKEINDPEVKKLLRFFPCQVGKGIDGRVSVLVNYNGESHHFSPEQLFAMQLTKLREISESYVSSKLVDVVINVPNYYTDSERRAVLDSARIAGLNCVKIINDLTAVGLVYGLYNKDLPAPDQPPKNVAFVSVGYTSTQVSICAFNSNKMKVLASAWDTSLGGSSFDWVLFNKFSTEFQERYKTKVTDSPKAVVRLLQQCEKVKKLMSANSQELPINVECLMNDRDFNSTIKRDDFEVLCSDLLSRFEMVLKRCLSLAKLDASKVDTVELVGGSIRIPALKNIVAAVFQQQGKTTLNADEAVARGCALQAAICSPGSRVREFTVTEACPYSITLRWEKEDSADQIAVSPGDADGAETLAASENSVEVFPMLHPIPSSRRLFFTRRRPFVLEAVYTNPQELPNHNTVLGSFKINGIPQKQGEASKIRVKVRMNLHGIFSVSQAEVGEEYEKEVEVEVDVPDDAPSSPPAAAGSNNVQTAQNGDIDASDELNNQPATEKSEATAKQAKPKAKKKELVKKKCVRYKDLPIDDRVMQLSRKQVDEFCEIEGKLFEQDQLEHKRADARNAVEEYVYDMRGKLQGPLSPYAKSEEQDQLNQILDETENWLYDEGEDLHRQAYVDRLNSMKAFGDRIRLRSVEHQTRPVVVANYESTIVHIRKVLDSVANGEESYNHLSSEQLKQLSTYLETYENWLREKMRVQNSKQLYEDPVVSTADISSQLQAFEAACNPILATPKPVPQPPPNPPKEGATKGEPAAQENCCNDKNGDKAENMDVD